MARSIYKVGEALFWYEDGKQPDGAIKVTFEAKARTASNKAREATTKAGANARKSRSRI